MRNSADSPRSDSQRRALEAFAVAAALCALAALAAAWLFRQGYILYYGDAQSHLNISRGIVDSRTPGYDQLGNVWLPVLHAICIPFVRNDWMWRTGVAGTIPVAMCFVVAGTFFYLAAREAYGSSLAAAAALSCLALNPNVLYLASIPMTEVVFLAGLAAMLFALLRYRATGRLRFVALALAASWWMSLTRYDGWFLIPFAALWLAANAGKRGWVLFMLFGAMASLAPLYWFAHNWWETGNALDFYNGPYSAKAIQASHPYPGDRDWKLAIVYYLGAGTLCSGASLMILGVAGAWAAVKKRAAAPVFFLLLTPVFYVWSMHSSASTPIFIPQLWPYSYYNSRYGLAMVVFSAFAAGAITLVARSRRRLLALAIPILSIAPWFIRPSKERWICWKESQVNSIARRAWTEDAADFMSRHYRRGQGILTASGSGDLAGILCRDEIPLREAIYIGNHPLYMANEARPDLIHGALWAVAQAGDPIDRALETKKGSAYRTTKVIQAPGAPALRIYERTDTGVLNDGDPIQQAARR
ncbi:MAG: hypothetical protein JO340_13780 [Acidobacteriaceae bacterium]|nr:hypothetical protein [Acidobacteriaceae bacterium]